MDLNLHALVRVICRLCFSLIRLAIRHFPLDRLWVLQVFGLYTEQRLEKT